MNDFALLITKQINGIKIKTRRYAVYVMLEGKENYKIRGVVGIYLYNL